MSVPTDTRTDTSSTSRPGASSGRAGPAGHDHRTARAAARAEARRRRLPLLPALLFVIVCTQVPFLLTIWYSLRSRNLLRPEGDQFVGLQNFADLFIDSTFRTAALNSVLITLGCVAVSVLLGLGLALLLDRDFA
ncbi:hypothetical protein [Nesterenkonia aethiopica]|uniref:Sugar ABC transporter permease n=2 Tax=Actinomycetes TaxID=1760 RepID=A0ABP6LQ46_9MICC